MEHLVKCVVGFFATLRAKSQVLRWVDCLRQGGG
jgi:hypothetical protein